MDELWLEVIVNFTCNSSDRDTGSERSDRRPHHDGPRLAVTPTSKASCMWPGEVDRLVETLNGKS